MELLDWQTTYHLLFLPKVWLEICLKIMINTFTRNSGVSPILRKSIFRQSSFSLNICFCRFCPFLYKNHQMLMDSLRYALKRDVSGHTQHVIDFLFFLRNFLFLWEKRIRLLFVIMLSIITFHIIFKGPCNTVSLKPFDQFRGQISGWYIYLICHVYFYFLFAVTVMKVIWYKNICMIYKKLRIIILFRNKNSIIRCYGHLCYILVL